MFFVIRCSCRFDNLKRCKLVVVESLTWEERKNEKNQNREKKANAVITTGVSFWGNGIHSPFCDLEFAVVWPVSVGGGAYEGIPVGVFPIYSPCKTVRMPGACAVGMPWGGRWPDCVARQGRCRLKMGRGNGWSACWVAFVWSDSEGPRGACGGWGGRALGWVGQLNCAKQSRGRYASRSGLAAQSHPGVSNNSFFGRWSLQCCRLSPVEDGTSSHNQGVIEVTGSRCGKYYLVRPEIRRSVSIRPMSNLQRGTPGGRLVTECGWFLVRNFWKLRCCVFPAVPWAAGIFLELGEHWDSLF